MGVGLQVVGVLLGVVSWCLQSSCTSSQVWRTRSQVESVSSSQRQFEGLWMSCASTSLGSVQCSRFKTLLGLPGEGPPEPHPHGPYGSPQAVTTLTFRGLTRPHKREKANLK